MPQYKVKVKWGKEVYPDVEANTDEPPLLFKAQLFALTGVQPERQKVMCKGVNLKDEDWDNFKLKDGAQILLMGTKEELPKEPVEKPVFVEDMNESELATILDMPAGLQNLGNTCYMNATVQCLKTVPELREALQSYSGGVASAGGVMGAESMTAALRDLYASMDKGNTIPPIVLLQVLHMAFPRFAEKNDHGGFAQQDANEFWTELVRMLQQKLPPKIMEGSKQYKSLVDQYFGISFDVELKNEENPEEPIQKSSETQLQLSCWITAELRYMHSGLKSRLEEKLTKLSESLGRDAVYSKTSKISRLPAYLTIQFVRFYYKEKGAINAKVLKDIKFPMLFDAFDLCSPELQEKLAPARSKFKEIEDKLVDSAGALKDTPKGDGQSDKKIEKKYAPYWFEDDLGSNNSGYYELQAVLTHKGRSSSSGHYVGWVKISEKNWVMCDDDKMSPVSEEDVLKLSGGGDWHCAYVLLYGPRQLEIVDSVEETVEVKEKVNAEKMVTE